MVIHFLMQRLCWMKRLNSLIIKVYGKKLTSYQSYHSAFGHRDIYYKTILHPCNRVENNIQIQLSEDPFGLEMSNLALDGYELVFVEDFQDNIANCVIEGNGNVVVDDTNPENYLLLVDLRNIDEGFICSFGPTDIENAILEVDFRYPEIRFTDAEKWQGYTIGFRDGFVVKGFPIQVPYEPTLQIRDFSGDSWKFPVHIKQGIQENRWYTLSTNMMVQKWKCGWTASCALLF